MGRPWSGALLLVFLASTARAVTVQDPSFSVELLHAGNGMISIVFGPGDRMYVAEKSGRILLFKPDATNPGNYLPPQIFASLAGSVDDGNEQGLLGLEPHPDFASNRLLYAFYSYNGGQRLVRLTADTSFDAVSGSPTVLLDGLPNDHSNHNAGDLHFNPSDGYLYLVLGDDAEKSWAQDLNRYHGKILRLDADGRGLAGNPFYDGDVDSLRSRIWGLGCRNPFRFTFHPMTHVMYVSENGGGTDRVSRWGAAAANGGWPDEFTQPSDPDVKNLVTLSPSITGIAVVRGGPFADPASPNTDALYVANWSSDSIRRWRLTGNQLDSAVPIEIDGSNEFVDSLNQPSHITFGPDGALYVASSGRGDDPGRLHRIRFVVGVPPTAAIATAPAPPVGFAPFTVGFTDASTDDGDIESWQWDFDDGDSSAVQNPSHTFDAPGVYDVRLTVTDDQGLQSTTSVAVTVNQLTSVTLSGSLRDGRDYDDQGLPVATELRLYQIDGVTPLSFAGGLGPDGNARTVAAGGVFDFTVDVNLTGCGIVVSAGEPSADGLQPSYRGFAVPCEASSFFATADFYLSDTAIAGRITDTLGDDAIVDLGASRDEQGALFAVPGGRDYLPPIPPSGVNHRVSSDELGRYYIPIPTGGGGARFHVDVVADQNADFYTSTTFFADVSAGTLVVRDVTLGLQSGGADCDTLSTGGAVDFQQVQAIFDAHCVGCHSGFDPNAGLDLSDGNSHDATVGQPSREVPGLKLVEPGSAELSFLFEKVNCAAPQVGARMPTGYALSAADQTRLRDWIEAGAPPPPVPLPEIDVTPGSLDFGRVTIGSSNALSVTIRNLGTAPLDVSGVSLTPGTVPDFTITSGPSSINLAPGEEARIAVTYAPRDEATHAGELQIESDDEDESLISVSLSGSGVPVAVPKVAVAPPVLDFGEVMIDDSSTLGLTIASTGTATLFVSSVAFDAGSSGDFARTAGPASVALAPGEEVDIEMTYTPSSASSDDAVLRISSNDPDKPETTLVLSGLGRAAPPPEFRLTSVSTVVDEVQAVSPVPAAELHVASFEAGFAEGLTLDEVRYEIVAGTLEGMSGAVLQVDIDADGSVDEEYRGGMISVAGGDIRFSTRVDVAAGHKVELKLLADLEVSGSGPGGNLSAGFAIHGPPATAWLVVAAVLLGWLYVRQRSGGVARGAVSALCVTAWLALSVAGGGCGGGGGDGDGAGGSNPLAAEEQSFQVAIVDADDLKARGAVGGAPAVISGFPSEGLPGTVFVVTSE